MGCVQFFHLSEIVGISDYCFTLSLLEALLEIFSIGDLACYSFPFHSVNTVGWNYYLYFMAVLIKKIQFFLLESCITKLTMKEKVRIIVLNVERDLPQNLGCMGIVNFIRVQEYQNVNTVARNSR